MPAKRNEPVVNGFLGARRCQNAIGRVAARPLMACAIALALACGAHAAEPVADADAASGVSKADMKEFKAIQGMLYKVSYFYHPDQAYQTVGLEAYRDGDKASALRDFLQASRYADKLSEAMVAMMYWNGEGTPVDRPRAYAWMDLAASRGYRDLLVQRELYWSKLSEDERKQALEIGQQVYAEYNDAAGLDRLNLKFSLGLSKVTGSHTGWQGNGISLLPTQGPLADRVDFNRMYGSALWNPVKYEHMKDVQWHLNSPLGGGRVEVGPLQVLQVPPALAAPAQQPAAQEDNR